MDPDGDGDPSDGIDGWRLDVAAEVPLTFWKEFRGWVKGLNPDAFLTGEIWWEDYDSVKHRDAKPWLDGAFDSVMNYRFGDAVYQFFNQSTPIDASSFVRMLSRIEVDYGFERILIQQNLFGSHDTSRIGSAVVNPQHRQDHGANLQYNRDYLVRKPSDAEKLRWRQMVAFQFLMPGAPFIYYGDEVGMWGADDPDCRKPMVWANLQYDAEETHPFGESRPRDTVEVDSALLSFYRKMASMRNDSEILRHGQLSWSLIDDSRRLLAFERELETGSILAVFNAGDHQMSLEPEDLGISGWSDWRHLEDLRPVSRLLLRSRGWSALINVRHSR
jgi:glycosidase